ncbi:MAG: hypothetical protein JJE03_06715 [Peptostreptococcaceae bacterium]|nr:hypothetical protein [Peptostreptococcaceae bacterium]
MKVDNRVLANPKTRSETGLDYIISSIDLNTPYGKRRLKENKPFFPGQEKELRILLDDLDSMVEFVKNNVKQVAVLSEILMEIKENTYTIKRCVESTLSVVEIFEIKTFLLQMRNINAVLKRVDLDIPKKYILRDSEELLNKLDPRRDRLNTFYIYDEFSEKLRELRKKKKEYDKQIRIISKKKRNEIKEEFGILLTPKFDISVNKKSEDYQIAQKIDDLELVQEDYLSVTYALKTPSEVYEITEELEGFNADIEMEEAAVREKLSQIIAEYKELLLENCEKIGNMDFDIAKAKYAIKHKCVKPEIVEEHILEYVEGRHIQVEDILKKKKREYCPVSISLVEGVTCITGANMGGKTISLKLSGLIPIMAQYGFFVPCEKAKIGLSNYIQILIGDSQSVVRGLSSFGSEMEELKQIFDRSKDRSLILIDEIASGTNPIEGLALTKSVVDYLLERKYITLITTHFESVTSNKRVKNMQVRGLADADFKQLNSEIRYAKKLERIDIIQKYMDYRLYPIDNQGEVPKDALNIAKMLGINSEIIERAKEYISKEKKDEK